METTLRPLGPDTLDDWLAFFDGPAFSDNPEWGTCYCRCYVFGARGMEAWDRACAAPGENRAGMIERIRAGTIDGLLCYRGGEVVGWVQYGPTARFETPRGPLSPADHDVASIVCFVVAPAHRRSGVARALLRGACAELAARGFVAVDARPPTEGRGPAMEQFPGPLPLYLSEGFTVAETGSARTRVRRALPASGYQA